MRPGENSMSEHETGRQLCAVAHRVTQLLAQREFDESRTFNVDLLSNLFCHELLTDCSQWKMHFWSAYRPWPDESGESIRIWIDDDSEHASIGIEIHADDPSDSSSLESSAVWGRMIADVFKLATAMTHRGLGKGFIILFGELNVDATDQRLSQFPLRVDGIHDVRTSELLTSAMDTGFFEELMHPHETRPPIVRIQMLAKETEQSPGFFAWSIELPE